VRSEISATDAVRRFSELLNNIKYRGDQYTVIRGGKPAAALVPAEEVTTARPLAELRWIFKAMPRLDPGDTGFARDIQGCANAQPPLPEETAWG
jgi:prevent-host-death family protein